jgi:transcriptional regulator with XRE-family HTH domain
MDTRIKAARQARGWSQSRLVLEIERLARERGIGVASRASLKTAVSRWENGHVVPDELYAGMLAEALGTSPSDLGLASLESILWVPPSLSCADLSSEYLSAMGDLLAAYAHTDNVAGPGRMIAVIVHHLSELEAAALRARGRLREEAFATCSRFAEFAGWLSQDGGDLAAAESWTQRALDYLEALENRCGERAYVLMRKASIAADRRDHGRSISLAVASERSAARESPQLHALALRQMAISHALAGDALESERAVERALGRIAERAPNADTGFDYCTPSYLLMEAGVAAARQKNYDVANQRLADAIRDWPEGFERDKGLCFARAALVEAARGNVEGACELGKQATHLAAVAGSARTQAVLSSLDRRLKPHLGATVVKEFRSYSGKAT